MHKLIILLITLIFLVLLLSGCYTILKHPGAEENYTAQDYQADCLGCHTDYHEYPYGYFYGYYPNYWWSSPRWGHYYAYPWWWDHYWYDGSNEYYHEDDNDLTPRSTHGEKAVRRDALRPPYSQGATIIGRSGSSGGALQDSRGKQTGQDTPADSKQNVEKRETKEKEDNTKATRRGGGRSRR